MKKQFLSLIGLFLLIENSFSFSMQLREANDFNPPPYEQIQQRAPIYNEEKARIIIDGDPAFKHVVNSINFRERQRAAQQDNNRARVLFPERYLVIGEEGTGKASLTEAAAALLHRRINIVGLSCLPPENNGDLKSSLLNHIRSILHQEEPSVVVFENIDEIPLIDERLDPEIILKSFMKAAERQDVHRVTNKFIIFATMGNLYSMSQKKFESFGKIEVKKPDLNRRVTILTNLLREYDDIINIDLCNGAVIEEIAAETTGFSIRNLVTLVKAANDHALEKIAEDEQNDDIRPPLERKDLFKALHETYPYKPKRSWFWPLR